MVRNQALLLLSLLPLAAGAPAEQRPPCCFNNPRYAGTCQVTPADDETCASILAYLNDPKAVGKPYCEASNLRRGWKEVPCQADVGDTATPIKRGATAACTPGSATRGGGRWHESRRQP